MSFNFLRVSVGILLLVSMSLSSASETLCAKGEKVYFSCAIRSKKIISLCGNVLKQDKYGESIGVDDPWLQYRFGYPGKVELTYPGRKTDSLEHFQGERIRALGGAVRSDSIEFVSGGIAYIVGYTVPDTGGVRVGVDIGDPKGWDIETRAKRLKNYPKGFISCAEGEERKGVPQSFFDLVEYLDPR